MFVCHLSLDITYTLIYRLQWSQIMSHYCISLRISWESVSHYISPLTQRTAHKSAMGLNRIHIKTVVSGTAVQSVQMVIMLIAIQIACPVLQLRFVVLYTFSLHCNMPVRRKHHTYIDCFRPNYFSNVTITPALFHFTVKWLFGGSIKPTKIVFGLTNSQKCQILLHFFSKGAHDCCIHRLRSWFIVFCVSFIP